MSSDRQEYSVEFNTQQEEQNEEGDDDDDKSGRKETSKGYLIVCVTIFGLTQHFPGSYCFFFLLPFLMVDTVLVSLISINI